MEGGNEVFLVPEDWMPMLMRPPGRERLDGLVRDGGMVGNGVADGVMG